MPVTQILLKNLLNLPNLRIILYLCNPWILLTPLAGSARRWG